MKTNYGRWQLLFIEGKMLAHLTRHLTKELRPKTSMNMRGSTEWEYDSRTWYRHVLPAIQEATPMALGRRLSHFAVEVKAFLRDMRALKENSALCPHENPAGQILYDEEAFFDGWKNSWRLFLGDYEVIRGNLSHADLECEENDCGGDDEIRLPFLPILRSHWSPDACEKRTLSLYDENP